MKNVCPTIDAYCASGNSPTENIPAITSSARISISQDEIDPPTQSFVLDAVGSSDTIPAGPGFHQSPPVKSAAALTGTKCGPGRPRKYKDNAAKQADYRKRQSGKQVTELVQKIIQIHHDNRGRLHNETTGYHWDGISNEKVGGKRVKPSGWGARRFEKTSGADRETEYTFINRHPFPKIWRLTYQEKERIIGVLTEELFVGEEASLAPEYDPDQGGWVELPSTLRCESCGAVVDRWHQASTHVLAHHSDVVRERIREESPRPPLGGN